MTLRNLICALGCALALSAWGAAPQLAAQANPLTPPSSPDGRVPIMLVLTENGGAPALLRRAGNGPRNVILLDSTTVDAQQLSDAVFHLLILEAQDPRGERRSDQAAQRVQVSEPHPAYPWASEALDRLRSAARQPVRGVSADRQHRVVQIWATPLRAPAR